MSKIDKVSLTFLFYYIYKKIEKIGSKTFNPANPQS